MKRSFIQAMQVRTARCAIGASTLRRQGAPGAVAAARAFLAKLPLRSFGVSRPELFISRLDRATIRLQRALPKGARGWGTARKALNIFLRDAAYNGFLRSQFALHYSEALLEIPLDSITAHELKAAAKPQNLPRWPGVSRLTAQASAAYQEAAQRVARSEGIPRVHLDVYWWGDRDNK